MTTLARPLSPIHAAIVSPMRSLTLSYLLAALGFLGVSGVHRFYLGKPITGLLWFFTGGLFMIGTIYDLITMESQVREANRYALPPGQAALPPAGYAPGYGAPPYPGYGPAAPDPDAELRDPSIDLELRMLKLARKHGGRLTTPIAAAELAVSMADADAKLSEIAASGHANVDVSDEGAVVYDFPALRV